MATARTVIIQGTGVKLALSMTCDGFDMDDDAWAVTLSSGGVQKTWSKDDSSVSDGLAQEDGTWTLSVDTGELGCGNLRCYYTAYVPDADFADDIRTEYAEVETNMTITRKWDA